MKYSQLINLTFAVFAGLMVAVAIPRYPWLIVLPVLLWAFEFWIVRRKACRVLLGAAFFVYLSIGLALRMYYVDPATQEFSDTGIVSGVLAAVLTFPLGFLLFSLERDRAVAAGVVPGDGNT